MPTLDIAAFQAGKISYADLVGHLTLTDVRILTGELYRTLQTLLAGLTDAELHFVPHDPQASDGDERGWTLSHIFAHLTASAEESARVAALLASGFAFEGRLRYEVPWETLESVQQLHERLRESSRMCQAYLEAWPTVPHLDVTVIRVPRFGPLNAIGMHILGILHGQGHLEQVRETLKQARS